MQFHAPTRHESFMPSFMIFFSCKHVTNQMHFFKMKWQICSQLTLKKSPLPRCFFLISADGGTDCASELTEVDNGPEDKSCGGEAASALLDGVTEEGGGKDGSKAAAGLAN